MKWLWGLLLGLLAFVVLVSAVGFWLLARSLPATDPHQVRGAVSAPVQVHYDERLRPYVFAESFDDAFFAQGYLHASHRLWQMDTFRRAGLGRLAELLGPPGLATDREIWRAGVPELARRMADSASQGLRQAIDAYVRGVNTYLAQGRPLPPEYLLLQAEPRPWQTADVFALGALMAYQSANNLENELLRLTLVNELGGEAAQMFFPDAPVPADPMANSQEPARGSLTQAFLHLDLVSAATNPLFSAPASGSNAWALAPPMTQDNVALFAFDSHDSVSLPNLTYDIHLFVDDQQIRGNSVPGLLGVINGFNEFMAWGFTNIGDSQDAFLEESHPTQDHHYKQFGEWYAAEVSTVQIPVRGAPAEPLTIVTTKNGRLINTNPPIAVRWAPLQPHGYGLDALFALNRATSYAAFNAALDQFVAPSATATYADITGRVAQRTIGLLPVRGTGLGLVPQSGVHGPWSHMLDMTRLPSVTSREGFVAAANRPFTNTDLLISADNAPGYRIRRIRDYLSAHNEHTVDTMLALQTDYSNLQAARLLPGMLHALQDDHLTHDENTAKQLLTAWSETPLDQSDAAAPLLFATWYQHFIAAHFASELSADTYQRLLRRSYLLNQAIDNHLLAEPMAAPVEDQLQTSFATAVAEVAASGPLPTARWDQQHQLLLKHELGAAFPGAGLLFNRGPYPAAGGNATVGRARYSHAKPYAVNGGATTRIVLKMTQPIQAWMISPGGQAGHPLSPWYNDQTQAWLQGRANRLQIPERSAPNITLLPE